MPFVTVEQEGHVAIVTLRRPEKLNALDVHVLGELAAVWANCRARCAILTGEGKAFVAGADISAMASMSPIEAQRFARAGHELCAAIELLPFPVIAAVNGFALGGGLELALACDFVYAAEGAKLGQPEVTLGVTPGFGGTQRLARRIGIAKARELVYTGDMVNAEQALEM